jgi:hypothetical protein
MLPLPKVHKTSNYTTANMSEVGSATNMHRAVDSDQAGDTKHRQSVTGIFERKANVVYEAHSVQLMSTEIHKAIKHIFISLCF